MDGVARYDGIAEWYDRELADSELARSARAVVLRLLGDGPGRLLDVGCGGGVPAPGTRQQKPSTNEPPWTNLLGGCHRHERRTDGRELRRVAACRGRASSQ